jgi:hypothetical protein
MESVQRRGVFPSALRASIQGFVHAVNAISAVRFRTLPFEGISGQPAHHRARKWSFEEHICARAEPRGLTVSERGTVSGLRYKRSNVYKVGRCCWWLEQERALLQPAGIVAPDATAARSVLGRAVSITRTRGQPHRLADGTRFVTIHPSFLLRIQDAADKEHQYRNYVDDRR